MKTIGNTCYIFIFLDLALNFWFKFYVFITLLEIHKPNINILRTRDQEKMNFANDLFWAIK